MRCEEFERVLQRQLDGEPTVHDDRALRRHALHCDSCRQLHDGMQLLTQCFASTQSPRVSPGLADRVCSAAELHAPRPRKRSIVWLAAAIVLGALGLGTRWVVPPHHPVTELAHRPSVAARSIPEDALFPELTGPNVTDSRESFAIMEAVEPVSRLFQAFGKTLGSPVRPIAISTSEAMSNLLKELPDPESPAIPIQIMRDMMGSTPSKKMDEMVPSS
jgi:hypothetical protein